ncbi:hexitol phosphatase HxpB [Ancylomarina euxinus]|uniref:Hexitol phosphatase HxpB n=1 Tax=Ancylomarina euxinus TaxID=2283627 RepID=A0A425Y398_9BACT|nr:hexitol phosphatase HxpB [Ancylomarina euxinus]MCZ4693219.1 hexitol phosphatase HxpB [Ancylomarina euxinus]MUP15355.1 hexitol phosphatase HxpB [Ancylomarina euxinus]RRG22519.1 hexitol phosphatase HxpB [Ancylomarina euxinus]
MIKAVIFDMDGLLIDSEPFWRISQKNLFSKRGIDLNEHDFESFMGKRIDEVVAIIYSRYPNQAKTQAETAVEIVDGVIKLVQERGLALPGVLKTLETLQKQNYKIGLASSSNLRIIKSVLKKLEIESYFEVVHSAQFEEYGKPHPQIFISTAKMLNISPSECLVLEDSFHGVIAALAANMKCVAIPDVKANNLKRFVIADKVLESMEDFLISDLNN